MTVSDQPNKTPLLELARSVPKDFRGEWEIQWFADGTPSGHAMAPVGKYVHDLADEIERLTVEGSRKDRRIRLLVAAAASVCEDADYDEKNDVYTVSVPPLGHLQDVIDHDGIFPVSGSPEPKCTCFKTGIVEATCPAHGVAPYRVDGRQEQNDG